MTSTRKFYSHNFAWKLGLNMHKHVKSRPKILKLDSLNISLSSWFWIFLKWSYMWMNNWFKILAFFLKHYVCYGLAWNGAVWFSCVWIGLVRYFMVWFGMVWSSFYDDLTPQRCRYQHVRGYFGIFFHCPSIGKVKSAVQLYKSADIKVKSLYFLIQCIDFNFWGLI